MAANNSISLVNLDFDNLKNQLKQYLRGQSQFSDYDFDGSNMSILLDILSYNTNLNAFYLNMIASEMFLDSAQLRNSIISIAKSLNYTPRSFKSAKSIVNLRFAQSGLSSFTIPAGTRFTGKNSRGSYQFLTSTATVLYPNDGFFTIDGVEIFEGSLVTETFVVDYSVENKRYILSNSTVDTDSIVITITENISTDAIPYSKVNSLFGIKSDSAVYFLQATDDSRYEVVFGDGVFGRQPKDGAIMTVTYRITSGPDADGSTNFILNDNLGALNGFGSAIIPSIQVVSSAFDGAEAETLENIRLRAPKLYQTQERAITTSDFATLISQEFSNIKNVFVYGGELVVGPPKFGTVMIAPVTFSGELLSQSQKNDIQTFLRSRTTIGITPMVVDPDYLFVLIDSIVKYDSSMTTLSANDIASLVKDTIQTFNEENLNNFDTELNLSRLQASINDSSDSIVGNQTTILLKKVFNTRIAQMSFPTVAFKNSLVPGTLISSVFVSRGRRFQYTDFNPNINTLSVTVVDNQSIITNTLNTVYIRDITIPSAVTYVPAGTIDYNRGTVTINSIVISSFEGSSGIEFIAKPVSRDVSSRENDILLIDVESGITVAARSTVI
jgi:hypothetical protein